MQIFFCTFEIANEVWLYWVVKVAVYLKVLLLENVQFCLNVGNILLAF
jgi:hypothetical protein